MATTPGTSAAFTLACSAASTSPLRVKARSGAAAAKRAPDIAPAAAIAAARANA
jgi:hypothetical protein